MNREEILQEILNLRGKHFLLEIATGVGKTRLTIEKIRQFYLNNPTFENILVVVPRLVHFSVWREEVNKWWPGCPLNITTTAYASLQKHKGNWDFVIFDECHHLSERCIELLPGFEIKHAFLLSATVPWGMKQIFRSNFPGIVFYTKTLSEAVEDNILPDPIIIELPLQLDNELKSETIVLNKHRKYGNHITSTFDQRDTARNVYRVGKITIPCTQWEYNEMIEEEITKARDEYEQTGKQFVKWQWLGLAGDRLKFLSQVKVPITNAILTRLKDFRTITFCNSIAQTEALGKYCINSKKKESKQYLNDFNAGKIKHITACNMLNEGINLNNCRIAIFNNYNSSDLLVTQRVGRTLRHRQPIIILPYYEGTKEEFLLSKIESNSNCNIYTAESIDGIIRYIKEKIK